MVSYIEIFNQPLYAFIMSHMRATCSDHFILLNLISVIILCEEYKL